MILKGNLYSKELEKETSISILSPDIKKKHHTRLYIFYTDCLAKVEIG